MSQTVSATFVLQGIGFDFLYNFCSIWIVSSSESNYRTEGLVVDLSQLPTEELERKVAERKAWIEKVIDFVTRITCEYGERLAHKVHNAHSYSKHMLKEVRGFSFLSEGSYSMMGGECIKIWYTDKSDAQSREVLFLEWWTLDNIHVKECFDEEKWAPALQRLMQDEKKVFAQKEKREQRDQKKQELQRQEALRHKSLLEQAARLRRSKRGVRTNPQCLSAFAGELFLCSWSLSLTVGSDLSRQQADKLK